MKEGTSIDLPYSRVPKLTPEQGKELDSLQFGNMFFELMLDTEPLVATLGHKMIEKVSGEDLRSILWPHRTFVYSAMDFNLLQFEKPQQVSLNTTEYKDDETGEVKDEHCIQWFYYLCPDWTNPDHDDFEEGFPNVYVCGKLFVDELWAQGEDMGDDLREKVAYKICHIFEAGLQTRHYMLDE